MKRKKELKLKTSCLVLLGTLFLVMLYFLSIIIPLFLSPLFPFLPSEWLDLQSNYLPISPPPCPTFPPNNWGREVSIICLAGRSVAIKSTTCDCHRYLIKNLTGDPQPSIIIVPEATLANHHNIAQRSRTKLTNSQPLSNLMARRQNSEIAFTWLILWLLTWTLRSPRRDCPLVFLFGHPTARSRHLNPVVLHRYYISNHFFYFWGFPVSARQSNGYQSVGETIREETFFFGPCNCQTRRWMQWIGSDLEKVPGPSAAARSGRLWRTPSRVPRCLGPDRQCAERLDV